MIKNIPGYSKVIQKRRNLSKLNNSSLCVWSTGLGLCAAHELSLLWQAGATRGGVCGLLIAAASLAAEHGLHA